MNIKFKSMSNFKVLTYLFCLFAFTALLSSCSKENSDEIEDIIVTEYKMDVTMRGVSVIYDAYAAYCNENGVESFSVSNNLNLLSNDAWANDISGGDFVIHYRKDDSSEFSVGGTIIESTIDGEIVKNFTLTDDSQVEIIVDTANSTEVIGSMSGNFLVIADPIAPDFEFVPFSVNFAGEVDSELEPIFCN